MGISIDKDDLTRPSSERKYSLGEVYVDYSSTDAIKPKYVYVKSHGALTASQPYQVSYSNTVGSEVISKAPGTIGSGACVGVSSVAVTSGYYAWLQFGGKASVLCTDTVAAGDFVEVLNAGTGLKLDGGVSGSTVEGATSLGIAVTAGTGAQTIVLSGKGVQIAAS